MYICISAIDKNLDSFVDPRFGRCRYFIFLDKKGNIKDVIPNSGINAIRGAGIQAAQTVVSNGADVLITGNIGPNAFDVLTNSGLEIYLVSPNTTVKQAFLMWKNGELNEADLPSVPLGFWPGYGQGRGLGRGRGLGFGRGLGRGFGRLRGLGRRFGFGRRRRWGN